MTSARDDYPLLALHADDPLAPPGKQTEIRHALHEIDNLRRWKDEAITVITRWEAVAARVEMQPGEFKSDAVGREIDRLRETIVFLSRTSP